MAFDCNKEGGVSSPENCSRICTEGALIQENPLTHCRKAKGWKSLASTD
uniref:Uncharacterized protein n=1 Tax=Arundo donax TaxID=35708 RepID=A0A0A9I126_ARUDO